MKTTWRYLDTGNAFCIPINGGGEGVGVILRPGQELYIGVYSNLLEKKMSLPKDIDSLGILRFVGLSTDELFYHGEWKVIGNIPLPPYPRPKHVVNSREGLVLCNFDKEILRPANESVDLPLFGYRKSVSNIAFTKALNCIHGRADLDYDFKKIDIDIAWQRDRAE